ncbi:MAG: hypothetical protein ACRC7O_01495, partial [Fimbriiglobus sp.]
MELHPAIAGRSCADCQRWQYEDSGDRDDPRFGDVHTLRSGLPMVRPKGTNPPCHVCPKIPASVKANRTPADAVEPTEQSREAYWHYTRCVAVGRFPQDRLVEENAGVIARVLRICDDVKRDRSMGMLAMSMMTAVSSSMR